jgi:catechol 2,3-dioxygenase-like lactoylglutathione lyase family enzyme
VSVTVADYDRSKTFYVEALGPLGYELMREFDGNVAGFGAKGKPDFWIIGGSPSGTTHVAFRSPDRAAVDAFHAAALAAGGKDNGQPGYVRITTSTTTARSRTIWTGTTSRRSATYLNRWRCSVEPAGLEPATSCMPCTRSPN